MKRLSFMLALCTACVLCYAQDANNELLKKLVEKNVLTQSEADSLKVPTKEEPKVTLSQTAEKIRQAFDTPYIRFGGYGQFMYTYSDVDKVKHSAEPKVVIFSMRGQLTKNFNYFVLTDIIKPTLYEFWGEWSSSKALNFRFGQQKTPLSLENQMSLTKIDGVSNTRSVSALIGMRGDVHQLQNGKNNTGRDVGVMVHGNLFKTQTHDLLEYKIGVFQGTGVTTSENNNSKDLAANLLFQPIKGFRFGGGAYFGEAKYAKPGTTEAANHVRNRWTIGSDYQVGRIYARAEWIRGNDGGIQKEGLHGMGMYYILPEKLNAFVKVDYLNQNRSTNNEVIDYMLGVNYYFYGDCRFQVNYIYSNYSKSWGAPNSNMIMGQMQIVF